MIGKLLRNVRAGEHRSPFAGADFAAPHDITVTSAAFSEGGAMPASSAGKGVGDNISPQLSWTGLPPETAQQVLIIDDVDVPLPRPLLHTVAVIEPGIQGADTGRLQPGISGMRFISGGLGHRAMRVRVRFLATGRTVTGFTYSRSPSRFPTTSPRPRRC
jgi:phosphatidylethanolamine-binding protein